MIEPVWSMIGLNSFSPFLSNLFAQDKIQKNIVVFGRDKQIVFGDYPAGIKQNLIKLVFFNVNNDLKFNATGFTSSNILQVYGVNITISLNQFVDSSFTFNNIFITYFANQFLVNNKNCTFTENKDYPFTCSYGTDIKNLPRFGMVIANNIYEIKPEKLFRLVNSTNIFQAKFGTPILFLAEISSVIMIL
jgi:hypothetical protein